MLQKRYSADKQGCAVIFTIDHGLACGAKRISLVGDFNHWDLAATPMKRRKDGSFAATLELECGRSYQFRYCIDHTSWENDAQADAYVPSPFADSANSVVTV